MPAIVQINYVWDIPEEEVEKFSTPEMAEFFWSIAGLKWKIWVRDAASKTSGGIYLFEDRASAQAYADGPVVEKIRQLPQSSNHSVRVFDIRENVTAVTGGPLEVVMERGTVSPELMASFLQRA